MKILTKGIIFLFLLSFWTTNVFGQEVDPVSNGKIQVKLEKYLPESTNENVSFCLTKVGEIINGEYNFETKYLDSNRSYSVDANALVISELMQDMMQLVKPESEIIFNEKGEVVFEQLEAGVYLLYPKTEYEYIDIEPSLVSLPVYDEMTGKIDYEIEVHPKYSIKKGQLQKGPKTSDEFQVEQYLFLGCCSIALAIVTLALMKKKNKTL